MSALPQTLSVEQLAELFEGRTDFIERLAGMDDPLVRARTLVHELPYPEKVAMLATHPPIWQRRGLSAHSAAEHGPDDKDAAVLAQLKRLERKYEKRHGFCFVIFVNRRAKADVLDVLRTRIDNPTDEELETGLRELVEIAIDRWS